MWLFIFLRVFQIHQSACCAELARLHGQRRRLGRRQDNGDRVYCRACDLALPDHQSDQRLPTRRNHALLEPRPLHPGEVQREPEKEENHADCGAAACCLPANHCSHPCRKTWYGILLFSHQLLSFLLSSISCCVHMFLLINCIAYLNFFFSFLFFFYLDFNLYGSFCIYSCVHHSMCFPNHFQKIYDWTLWSGKRSNSLFLYWFFIHYFILLYSNYNLKIFNFMTVLIIANYSCLE